MPINFGETKVLVVDNQNEIRNMRETLNQIGFHHISDLTSGLKVLTEIKKNMPDLILVNCYLPQYSGMQVFKSLRADKELSNLKFIMVTPHLKRQELDEMREQGVDNIISRPFKADQLKEKIFSLFGFSAEDQDKLAEEKEKEGKALYEKRDFKAALVKLREACDIKTRASCFFLSGRCYMELEMFDQASAAFHNTLTSDSSHPELNYWTGLAHQKKEEYLASVKFLEKAAKEDESSAETQVDLGKSYLGADMADMAEKAFDRATIIDSDNINNRTEIGNAYLNNGMYEKAESAFGAAIDVCPSDIPLYNRMAIATRKQGKYQEAISIYVKAINVAPKDEGLYYNLARALHESGDTGKAVKSLEKAIAIDPGFDEAVNLKKEYEGQT